VHAHFSSAWQHQRPQKTDKGLGSEWQKEINKVDNLDALLSNNVNFSYEQCT